MCPRSIALAGLALVLPLMPAFGTAHGGWHSAYRGPPVAAGPSQPAHLRPVHLSTSYEAVVLTRVLACWNPPPLGATDLIVEIHVVLRPDGTVETTRVLDEERYEADLLFRRLADSARRSVLSPHCQPFPLPVDRFDQWQEMILIFDPRSD